MPVSLCGRCHKELCRLDVHIQNCGQYTQDCHGHPEPTDLTSEILKEFEHHWRYAYRSSDKDNKEVFKSFFLSALKRTREATIDECYKVIDVMTEDVTGVKARQAIQILHALQSPRNPDVK